MSDSRVLTFTSSLIEKTHDFRYFGLIFSFVLILDSALAYSFNSSLYMLKLSDFSEKIMIGNIILFIVMFSFYLSMLIPWIQKLICILIYFVLPSKLVYYFFPIKLPDSSDDIHFIRASKLETFALKNNNKVAYEILSQHKQSIKEVKVLSFFSLSLFVSFIVNIFLTNGIETTIGNSTLSLFTLEQTPFTLFVILGVVAPLVLISLYFAVVVHCGLGEYDRDRILVFNHGIDKNT